MTATLAPADLEPAGDSLHIHETNLGSTDNAAPELTTELAILASLWQTWASAPGSELRACQLEDQCQSIAKMVGTTGSKLREWCIANRAMVGL
jgi:hypothetical protein